MTVPSIKTFSKSLKYVDTTYSLLRAGTFLSSQYGPNSRKPESGKSFSSCVSNTSPLGRVFLRSSLDSIIPKHISELEGRTNGLKSRDFMNLPGVTGSKNLTPTVESGANFYFDTHKLVTTLQSHGFSLDQAETITDCLTEILTNGATTMSRHMVRYMLFCFCPFVQAAFHLGRPPEYVRRELEKHKLAYEKDPHVSAYQSREISWIAEFFTLLT